MVIKGSWFMKVIASCLQALLVECCINVWLSWCYFRNFASFLPFMKFSICSLVQSGLVLQLLLYEHHFSVPLEGHCVEVLNKGRAQYADSMGVYLSACVFDFCFCAMQNLLTSNFAFKILNARLLRRWCSWHFMEVIFCETWGLWL